MANTLLKSNSPEEFREDVLILVKNLYDKLKEEEVLKIIAEDDLFKLKKDYQELEKQARAIHTEGKNKDVAIANLNKEIQKLTNELEKASNKSKKGGLDDSWILMMNDINNMSIKHHKEHEKMLEERKSGIFKPEKYLTKNNTK